MGDERAQVILAAISVWVACAIGAWQLWHNASENKKKKRFFYFFMSTISILALVVMALPFLRSKLLKKIQIKFKKMVMSLAWKKIVLKLKVRD